VIAGSDRTSLRDGSHFATKNTGIEMPAYIRFGATRLNVGTAKRRDHATSHFFIP
jgi:hypothetical protein